jgi:hypothetical protein
LEGAYKTKRRNRVGLGSRKRGADQEANYDRITGSASDPRQPIINKSRFNFGVGVTVNE